MRFVGEAGSAGVLLIKLVLLGLQRIKEESKHRVCTTNQYCTICLYADWLRQAATSSIVSLLRPSSNTEVLLSSILDANSIRTVTGVIDLKAYENDDIVYKNEKGILVY